MRMRDRVLSLFEVLFDLFFYLFVMLSSSLLFRMLSCTGFSLTLTNHNACNHAMHLSQFVFQIKPLYPSSIGKIML